MSALHYIDGDWRQGNPPIMGPMTHAAWMSSVAFDGARAFGGAAPDLDRHCARAVRSACAMGLAPTVGAEEIEELAWQGIGRFPEETELYIRPLFYAEDGFVMPEPDSTRFVLSLFELPLPEPAGFSACLSSTRRPSPETAPTDAKASCLYPQNARALREAKVKGYENAVVLDLNGNVAEFVTANLFIATDGAVHTPAPNRTFLDGITRQRVIGLLRDAGTEVVERTLDYAEVCAADEVFATSNYAKVSPAIRIEDRDLQPGPLYAQARGLYFDFARTCVRGTRI